MADPLQPLLQMCGYCRTLRFYGLTCPTFSDLAEWHTKGRVPAGKSFDAETAHTPAKSYGTLARIKQSSSDCQMCKLVWKIIVRHNGGEEPAFKEPQAGNRDFECFIFLSDYANFRAPTECASGTSGPLSAEANYVQRAISGTSLQNLIRRYSLFESGVPPDFHEDDADCEWWEIFYCIQRCALEGSTLDPYTAWYNPAEATEPVFGGRLRPLVIDLEWIRQWLRLCEIEHGGQCSAAPSCGNRTGARIVPIDELEDKAATHFRIRLINVTTQCIETFDCVSADFSSAAPAYAALSYLWGGSQLVTLQKHSLHRLKHEGAFKRFQPSRTVADAIELVSGLSLGGLQHLWVDALCIVQDDDDDKQVQIANMASIYSSAAFTIVAAAGDDAEAGLPGLHLGTRTAVQSVVLCRTPGPDLGPGVQKNSPGYAVMETLNPLSSSDDEYFDDSKYSTRGWTLQEQILSNRQLIFTKEQVYFSCSSATYCEESHFETRLSSLMFSYHGAGFFKGPMGATSPIFNSAEAFWHAYASSATIFSVLQLTNPGDALDAFSGITKALSEYSGEQYLWGMPTSRMSLALLWRHGDGHLDGMHKCKRRLEKTTLPVSNRQNCLPFPSWSWLGWSGSLSFEGEHDHM